MSKEAKEKKSYKSRLRRFFRIKNVLITIFVVLFLVQYIQIQSIFGSFSFLEGRDSSLVTEIGEIKEAYLQFGTDLNEIRDYLRLPTKNYFGLNEVTETQVEEGQNQDQLQLAVFQYINYLSAQKALNGNIDQYKSFLENISSSATFSSFLTEQSLFLSKITDDDTSISLNILTAEGYKIVFFYLSKEEGKLFIKTIKTKEEVASKTYEEFETQLTSLIRDNKDELVKLITSSKEKLDEIASAINSENTKTALAQLGITMSAEPTEKDLKMIYSINNKSSELIGEIVFDPVLSEITLLDKKDNSSSLKATDLSTALVPFLEKLDTRTLIEKKADEAIAELNKTIADEGFKLLLSQSGLTISDKPREDEDRIYYDIFDAEGIALSSLVVEKATGVINIVNPDGTNSENIFFFDPDNKKKTLEIPTDIPDYGDDITHEENTFNILIAGKHGSLVDTMIFTHIDETTKKIRMVSIPRDLYYNGRKINAFPYFYGMPELKKVLSDITGYELDKYILIDMYAFIDVIDLVGGIDIHLDSAVIDPTYRTVDDGVEGTLHYEPGDYHLGGVEALRLARTRHTSSDFARAERQQLIIEALQTKARNFGFGDADTIYEISKTVLEKTETDITLDEAIAYYFRYQNYDIESNNVMSSGNVLYVPPYITTEDCNAMIAEAKANGSATPTCENENHAYTLIPLNNNWNVVKWFFKENFEGELAAI